MSRLISTPHQGDKAFSSEFRKMGETVQNDVDGKGASDASPHQGDGLPLENLTEQIKAAGPRGISPFVGDARYTAFFNAVHRSLHRHAPRHLIIVRDRGVGDRAALIELARQGIEGTPRFLAGKQFLLFACQQIPSEEIRAVIQSLLLHGHDSKELVFCLDGFARLLQTMGPVEIRAFLSSALCRTLSNVIGLLSPREYEEYISGDAELQDLFSTVFLFEPDRSVAVNLVLHFATGLGTKYGVRIKDEAIQRAVILTDCYMMHERLPDKATKVLRAVCDDIAFDRSQCGVLREEISEEDVIAKVSQYTGIPEATLTGVGESIDYQQLLSDVVVGQDHAIDEVATELGLIKAGMIDDGKPASVMMFVGQTGTGKTEMAKALARIYSSTKRLRTFTLGNFSEPHSVSGIIGVPPGYVGHDQGGRLINELNSDPYGVFLLDEADKAHPDVMQPFLNLFDEGWIGDQKGNKAFANRAIFILTTNVGQRQIADMCRSGKTNEEITWAMKEALAKIRHSKSNRPVFTSEFLARIKRIIVFRSLGEDAMLGISRRLVRDLQRDWYSKRAKTLVVAERLVEAVGRQAFQIDQKAQGREGGRIVRKLLANIVESSLRNAITACEQQYRTAEQISIDYREEVDQASQELSPKMVAVRFISASRMESGL